MTLREFQNITLIANIPSILKHGIVSYVEAAKLPHFSVALEAVQISETRRRFQAVWLFTNMQMFIFHARNPMMSRRRNEAARLCVLKISTDILSIPGAVITDQNGVASN